jgi:ribosomal small subunit protein bTHX
MGRGDSRTKRGKIFKASHGNSRPRKKAAKPVAKKVVTTTGVAKKTPAPKKAKA